MSLTSETGLTMPVVPAGMNYGGSCGSNGGWGGDGAWWIIILFLFVFCGWGNGWNGNGNGGGTATQGYDTRADLQRGFDAQSITTKLDGLTNGLCQQGYQNQQGFHGVDNAVCTLGYQVQQGVNDINTTALQGFNGVNTTMLQGFNATNTALMQGQNAISTQIADCCCTTQRAIDGVNYNLSTQSCAIQNTMNNNTRDVVDSQRSGTQAIMDKLCQMEYNGLNDKYQAALAENQALRFQASQVAQNGYIDAVGNSIVAQLRVPQPVPAYQVPAPYPYAGNGCCGSC